MALNKKRSKWLTVLVLPLIVCVWFLGWFMKCAGFHKPVKTKSIKISGSEVATIER
jgi:hypothetical protein